MAAKKTTPTKKTSKTLTAAELAAAVILKKKKVSPITAKTDSHLAVPSGSALVDDLIGGTLTKEGKPVCMGFPRRRISEVFGAESSGKTTLALHAIAEVQRQGGTAMFLDFEYALHSGYAKSIGVNFDPKRLLLYQPDNMEDGFEYMYLGIMAGLDLIVTDSVAAMVPKSELEKGIMDAATIGAQARIMSQNLPKLIAWMNSPVATSHNAKGTAVLFINQTRASVNTSGGKGKGSDKTTSGGNALKFYASLRLQATRIRSEIATVKDKFSGKDRRLPFGNHTQVKVVKNKMDGKQGHATDIFIRYGFGIDDYYSIIEAAVTLKLVSKKGAWFVFDGESYQGREAFRSFLKNNPKIFDALRKKVLNLVQAAAQELIPDDEDLDDTDELMISIESAAEAEAEMEAEAEEVELDPSDFPPDVEEGAEAAGASDA